MGYQVLRRKKKLDNRVIGVVCVYVMAVVAIENCPHWECDIRHT